MIADDARLRETALNHAVQLAQTSINAGQRVSDELVLAMATSFHAFLCGKPYSQGTHNTGRVDAALSKLSGK